MNNNIQFKGVMAVSEITSIQDLVNTINLLKKQHERFKQIHKNNPIEYESISDIKQILKNLQNDEKTKEIVDYLWKDINNTPTYLI